MGLSAWETQSLPTSRYSNNENKALGLTDTNKKFCSLYSWKGQREVILTERQTDWPIDRQRNRRIRVHDFNLQLCHYTWYTWKRCNFRIITIESKHFISTHQEIEKLHANLDELKRSNVELVEDTNVKDLMDMAQMKISFDNNNSKSVFALTTTIEIVTLNRVYSMQTYS